MQDTPANRITWGGCLTTSSMMMPYMSGNWTGTYSAAYGYKKTCFYQQIPSPSYLMAAVTGDLTSASMGDTTTIIAEPAVINAATAEFSNLQAILNTVE